MKKIIFLILLFATIISVSAQEDSSPKKFSFSNITEFGFPATGSQGVTFEATTVYGFAINRQHCIGIGFGFGLSTKISAGYSLFSNGLYTPIYFNYRVYFKPEKTFSPHINFATGGIFVNNGKGSLVSIASGFKARKFSLSSGLSFMAINREREVYDACYYEDYSYPYIYKEWIYLFGVTLKVGVTF